MNKFILLKKAPKLLYSGERITLPNSVIEQIEKYWLELISSGKNFRRGDVFTISKVNEKNGEISVEISLSDYAHYLATINGKIDKEYACRVVHSSVMIETLDGEFIFGEMGGDTALPGRIQCIGGGITREDLSNDGKTIDIEKNAANEMAEEVGLFADNGFHVKEFFPWAIVESGPNDFLGVVYWAKALMGIDEFLRHYAKFEAELIEKGEKPELSKIIHVSKGLKDKGGWLSEISNSYAEYLPLIFEKI